MHERRDNSDIEYEIPKVEGNITIGEGSEGVQAFEVYQKASNNFFYWLGLLANGEGDSSDYVQEQLESAKQDILNVMVDMADGEDHTGLVASAIDIILDLDRRAQKVVGPENVRFPKEDKSTAFDVIANEIQEDFDLVADSIESKELMDDYTAGTIEDHLGNWLDDVVDEVYNSATPNYNDARSNAMETRKASAKKLAQEAIAVAIGTLPAIGAMVYFDRKNRGK